MSRLITLSVLACMAGAPAFAQAEPDPSGNGHLVYGPRLEGFDYPHPVQIHAFTRQTQAMEMAYMDIAPQGEANGRTALLLHGKNFCGATWDSAIAALTGAGWRVVVPDQIGFCKSTKPDGFQFSFDGLAADTAGLLDALEIERAAVVGHSMGGMLAARFALAYPGRAEHLVMVNPIGLEDVRAEGVPYASIDQLYQSELETDYASIRAYQLDYYYNGEWDEAYDIWVEMLAGMYAGEGGEIVAYNQAQTSEMVFTQPVVQDFPRLEVPATLMIGQLDRTAPGAGRAPEDIADRLGDYPALGRAAADAIPDATLISFDDLGHSPQVEAPDRFNAALIEALAED